MLKGALNYMKVLWICGLPRQVQEGELGGRDYGAHAEWSWILGHLPPPNNVELHITCPSIKVRKPKKIKYSGCTFHLVPCLPGRLQVGFLLDPFFFRGIVKKLNPDVVHGWGTEDSYSVMVQTLAPEKCVVQVQGLINAYRNYLPNTLGIKYVALQERKTLSRARTVFVESGYSKEITEPYCGEKTSIIQVDHPLRSSFLKTPSASGRGQEILFLGSICERKGYQDAVTAFQQLPNMEWKMTLVGNGSPQDVAELNEQIAQVSVAGRITHIPQASSDTIVELMQRASIFLLPSKMDTGPTALKEALAMGLWPICYANSGPKEYITRFGYGSLASTGDVVELAEQLKTAVDKKPWLHNERLEMLVSRVRHELCADTIWQQLIRHYHDIAKEI